MQICFQKGVNLEEKRVTHGTGSIPEDRFMITIHRDIFLLENHEDGGQDGEVWKISPQLPGSHAY